MNPEDKDYKDALDESFDYDPEYDRTCSYPCEICGETWEDDDDGEPYYDVSDENNDRS